MVKSELLTKSFQFSAPLHCIALKKIIQFLHLFKIFFQEYYFLSLINVEGLFLLIFFLSFARKLFQISKHSPGFPTGTPSEKPLGILRGFIKNILECLRKENCSDFFFFQNDFRDISCKHSSQYPFEIHLCT